MNKLTDLFVPFKVVHASRVEPKLLDLLSDWLTYMQSRNNPILPLSQTLSDSTDSSQESIQEFQYSMFPRVPNDLVDETPSTTITAPVGNHVKNILLKYSDRYKEYVNEYERYVSEHLEDADEDMRIILSNIAAHESAYNPVVQNPKSTASGWFLFIDSTRQSYSTMNRELFKLDRLELIAAAVKLYKAIYNKYYNSPKWKPLIKKRGLSVEQVIYGGWFRPKSLLNYLEKGYDIYSDPQGTTLLKVWDSYK